MDYDHRFSPIIPYNGPVSALLLETKLFKSALRPTIIARQHLIDRLNDSVGKGTAGFAARLTLVSAPAGFGKTTLVSAWLAQVTQFNPQLSDEQLAWLSLDENDNDPSRFLTYLIAALQTAVSDLGEKAAALLQSAQPPAAETILTLLINDISQNNRPLILVLDDYHVITTPSIHQVLGFLLEHLPPQLHLLLTTRSDPPLALSRLRARGQVVEIRAHDLRFTVDEATQFFNQVMDLNISKEETEALDERIEGWIAGLQLAALTLKDRVDRAELIAAFTGSHRFILDYLTDEVLDRRPKGTRKFLLQTAVLGRLCGPLCDAVTGQRGSQAILEQLEQANLFLVPLDGERHWYRYHHLFADVLRSRQQQASTSATDGVETAGELHRRASIWFEQEGLIDEALRHALSAPDIERAAALVEQNSQTALQRSEIFLVRTWLDLLPAALVQTRPRLILARGWVLVFTGHSQEANRWLLTPRIMTLLEAPELPADIGGEWALLRAAIARFHHDDADTLKFAQQALDFLPEPQRGLRAGAIYLMGTAHFRQGDSATASQAFAQAAALGETAEASYMALMAAQDLASIQIRQGQLTQTRQTCQQAMRLAARWGGRTLPSAGMAYIDFGGVLYEQNDLAGAAQALTYGIDLLRGSTEQYLLAEGYTILARVYQARGDPERALAAIEQGEAWFNQVRVADFGSGALLALGRARLWLRQGNLLAATRWGQQVQPWPEDTHLGYLQTVTLIRLRLAQYQHQARSDYLHDAAAMSKRLLAAAETKEWWGLVIELALLQAIVCQVRRDTTGMLINLEQALTLAEPEGYCRLFLDEGEPVSTLLRQARQQGLFPHTIDKLLAAFTAEILHQGRADVLPELLSERELEVLRLVATGAANQEIADQLFIAVSTVKKHIGNILVKLDAPNRVQAIVRGRALGLLP